MNQPCYNSIALARHQREIDRQEAKEHWIAAAVDRLLCDNLWCIEISEQYERDAESTVFFNDYIRIKATQKANQEYQQHLSALEQARIDGQDGL